MAINRRNIIIISTPIVILGLLYLYLTYIRNKVKNLATGTDTASQNVQAFLLMIRRCEGTSGANGYRTTYGYSTFKSYADHPAITGEWTGKTLSDTMCRNAGFSPGCKSTAAGAYQFIKPTWKALKLKLNLPDFSPLSQDIAAIEKLREIGVLDLVQAGKITQALQSQKLGGTWASLPTSTAKQNPKSQSTAIGYYTAAGGTLA